MRTPLGIIMGAEKTRTHKLKVIRFGLDKLTFSIIPDNISRYADFVADIPIGNNYKSFFAAPKKSFFHKKLGKQFECYFPSSKGTSRIYKYGIRCAEYRLELARPEVIASLMRGNTPPLLLSPTIKTIYSNNIEQLNLIIEQIGAAVGVQGYWISNIEVAADFIGWCPTYKDIVKNNFECKASHYIFRSKGNANNIETLYHGSENSPIRSAIYNKTVECHIHSKEWLLELYGQNADETLWRLEFKLRREALKQFEIINLNDLATKIYTLWAHLTKKWLVHNRKGIPSPEWRALQKLDMGDVPPLIRNASPVPKRTNAKIMDRIWNECVNYGTINNCDRLKQVMNVIVKGLVERSPTFKEEVFQKRIKMFE